MDYNTSFESFNKGKLIYAGNEKKFENLPWNNQPSFEGVSLKHIVTSAETNGVFSYHLVRIAPNCKIGRHIHETQLETHEVIAGSGQAVTPFEEGRRDTAVQYAPGTLTILDKKIPHEVIAGEEGLYLFAKFMPALV